MKITHREVFALSSFMLRDQTKGYGKEEIEQMLLNVRRDKDEVQKETSSD
ncbi:hypothetical protein ACFQ3J_00330 [Paenibacillus provencensis]|uniref:Uncharacterized protein n=1 Tax=Paenibacillus provencensis TaxID=441151 RepID=A0ABW3PQG9_9BACL|nr:hypothetical protein [Paenibacillus sp. MER 78]MCM3130960.1 hypothetical protein [Paenibacillus sp. MER 78]